MLRNCAKRCSRPDFAREKRPSPRLDAGQILPLREILAEHLGKWHWMRDRDLLFEPWDTCGRVIETALKTDPHAVMPYQDQSAAQYVSR